MTRTGTGWELADDAEEVHRLLLASDAASATAAGPPPRDLEGTRRRVTAAAVHLLRLDGRAAAMVTLGGTPPFDLADTDFAPLEGTLYMQRLAVDPILAADHPYLGARAIRHALDQARVAGAPAVRAEANPTLDRVLSLLLAHGFTQVGDRRGPIDRPRIYLERRLTEARSEK